MLNKILVSSLGMKVKLDISHAPVDEGLDYEKRLGEYSALLGVQMLFGVNMVEENKGTTDMNYAY